MKNAIKRKDAIKFAAFGLVVIGLFVGGHVLHLGDRFTLEGIRSSIEAAGPWQIAVFAAGYLMAALVPFPTALLSTASGALWGPYLGTLATVVCATLAACIPFMLSRLMGRGLVGRLLQKHATADRCDRFAGRNGFLVVLMMRLVPLFPWDMVNYVSGLCGIRFRDYLVASMIGTIPASFTYNLIGASLGKPLDKTPIIIMSFIVVALAGGLLLHRRKTQEKKS